MQIVICKVIFCDQEVSGLSACIFSVCSVSKLFILFTLATSSAFIYCC